MFKYISTILALTLLAFANQNFTHPLPVKDRSVEFGGNKPAIEVYQDGVGVVLTNQLQLTNNSSMNTLVFKYGEEAKKNNVNVIDYVINSSSTTTEEKEKANKLKTVSLGVLSTLSYPATSTVNYSCPNGGTLDGTLCVNVPIKYVYSASYSNKRFSCPAGGVLVIGTGCVVTTLGTESAVATTSYSCPDGGTLDGTICKR